MLKQILKFLKPSTGFGDLKEAYSLNEIFPETKISLYSDYILKSVPLALKEAQKDGIKRSLYDVGVLARHVSDYLHDNEALPENLFTVPAKNKQLMAAITAGVVFYRSMSEIDY